MLVTDPTEHDNSETHSRDSDLGYLLSDVDVIDDNVSASQLPLADAALGSTLSTASTAFYCRSEQQPLLSGQPDC